MGTTLNKEENNARTWATFCHLSALIGYLGIPLGNILGPLIVWLIKRNEYPLVEDQGKESLNFQLSMFIYMVVSIILCFVLIGFLFLGILCILHVVFTIIAGVKANNGELYRYPFIFRFIH